MKFNVGDVVFFKGKSFYSTLIYSYNFIKYGESGYSHVGIITKIKKSTIVIHEALGSGFQANDYEKWWLNNKIELGDIKIRQSIIKLTNVYKNAEIYYGRGYAWSDILFIGLAFLTKFKFSITGANRLICSEAVARILYDSSNKKINFEKEYNKPYDLVTPMDIFLSKQLHD